jgi:hypothetical protein
VNVVVNITAFPYSKLMAEKPQSSKIEPLLYTLARMFAADGAATEVALLTYSVAELIEHSPDEWSMNVTVYSITLHVPIGLYLQFEYRVDDIEEKMNSKLLLFCDYNSHEQIRRLKLRPAVIDDPEWKSRAHAWLNGIGVNNQGRVRSDNVAPLSEDGLLFRSKEEINFYMALKSKGVSFAPLPVFVRGGDDYQRLEPDFLVIYRGVVAVVEVDGDTVHHETPVEAHVRTSALQQEGIVIERISASSCRTLQDANNSADRLLGKLLKIKSAR